MRALFFLLLRRLASRFRLQPVRSRLAPQERCAQLSCASKPGGFMQPSGARGAHNFLVRRGDAGRKRKEKENFAGTIRGLLSGLSCGFPGSSFMFRPGDEIGLRAAELVTAVLAASKKADRPLRWAVHAKING